jgi:thiol-disulfide isomerase/thioredoxin
MVLLAVLAPPLWAQSAPVMDLAGYNAFLREHKGKTIVVDFWATWCGPCRKKLPELRKCRDTFAQDDVTIIGISLDFNPATLDAFLEDTPVNYPVYLAEDHLAAQLEVQAIPMLFIYDPKGDLVVRDEGLTPHETLCAQIHAHAKKP